MRETTTETAPIDDYVTSPTGGVARRRRTLVGLAVIAIVVVAVLGWWVAASGSPGADGSADAEPTVVEAVVADLEEVTTLEGTLGRAEGEIVSTAEGGTVTAVAAAGKTVASGEVLYEIDAAPVVLLSGATPAYRDLSMSADTASVTSRIAGTLTAVAEEGAVIEQGDVLFVVDGDPVVALYGETPAYRTMRDESTNQTGDDILQLESALVDLGYDPGDLDVDGEFTDYTEQMVENWQGAIGAEDDGVVTLGEVVFIPGPTEVVSIDLEVGDLVADGRVVLTIAGSDPMSGEDVRQLETSLSDLGYDVGVVDGTFDQDTKRGVVAWQEASGMEADGVVDLGEVIFLPGDVRIASIAAGVGSPVGAGGAVLTVTSSEIVVTAELPAQNQDILELGQAVTVVLPDSTRASGTVSEIEAVATRNASGETVFDVTIDLNDSSVAGTLDEAPVDVEIVTDSVSGVLVVPVTALLALREGGYAVERVNADGATTLVAVDPGFYADGRVEIKGAVSPGDEIVVP